MSRAEFVIATAVALFVAFSLGWLASWLVHRFTRASGADLGELDRMAQALHETEEERDRALTRAEDAEAAREAAMEGMVEAREEAEALRAWIERAQVARG